MAKTLEEVIRDIRDCVYQNGLEATIEAIRNNPDIPAHIKAKLDKPGQIRTN